MKFRIAILLLFYCLFTSSTCEKPFDVGDIDSTPRLVVNSVFSPDSTMKVTVSHSLPVLLSPTETVRTLSNVEVEVTDPDGIVYALGLNTEAGFVNYYALPAFKPIVGGNYEIEVSVPGYETVFSNNTIPHPNKVVNVTASNEFTEKSRKFGLTNYWTTLNFELPNKPGDHYYHLYINREKVIFNDNPNQGDTVTLFTGDFLPNDLIDFNNQDGLVYFDKSLLLKDEAAAGASLNFSVDVGFSYQPTFELVKRLRFELRTVSEDYYKYHTSLRKQSYNIDDPFAEPTILFNNIENGYGLFGGYSVTLDSLSL